MISTPPSTDIPQLTPNLQPAGSLSLVDATLGPSPSEAALAVATESQARPRLGSKPSGARAVPPTSSWQPLAAASGLSYNGDQNVRLARTGKITLGPGPWGVQRATSTGPGS
jgi:hypothetical protein